jgi:5-methyltetrahydrofolate--homocysteine methyltransferase
MTKIELKEIDITQTLEYLGFKGTLPDAKVLKAIKQCETKLLEVITLRYIYKVDTPSNPLLVGNDINELMQDCEKTVFMCCTLGLAADRFISTAGVTDIANELFADALANAAIEQICDMTEEIISKSYPGYKRTMRFSPGYGDFPLSIQPKILGFLNAEKLIGVTAKESFMMTPLKSVTAVIGLKK